MPLDRSFVEENRAATHRIGALAHSLTDEELQRPVGDHWTIAITLVHIAFWDRRLLQLLDETERAGTLTIPPIDLAINDISLPIWAAVPAREAARLAVEAAEAVDRRIEAYPQALLEQIDANNERWLRRARHRNSHLDEVDAARRS